MSRARVMLLNDSRALMAFRTAARLSRRPLYNHDSTTRSGQRPSSCGAKWSRGSDRRKYREQFENRMARTRRRPASTKHQKARPDQEREPSEIAKRRSPVQIRAAPPNSRCDVAISLRAPHLGARQAFREHSRTGFPPRRLSHYHDGSFVVCNVLQAPSAYICSLRAWVFR
jgi:hypothetical protein